jgi:recombination protein RecR
MQAEILRRLAASFKKLPAVGQKNAMRYAYAVIDMDTEDFNGFIEVLKTARETVKFCKECGDYTDTDVCEYCQTADKETICVVKEPRDIAAIQKTGNYHGLFHTLHGALDFQKGVGVEDIRIKELIPRLQGVKEVIIATNPDISGEMTATYLAGLLKPLGIKVTRPASGIPMGCEIEYADELTLSKAFQDRKEV